MWTGGLAWLPINYLVLRAGCSSTAETMFAGGETHRASCLLLLSLNFRCPASLPCVQDGVREMRRLGLRPNRETYMLVLRACAGEAAQLVLVGHCHQTRHAPLPAAAFPGMPGRLLR